MIDGFSPAPQRMIVVQTSGVGSVRGVWPAKDPSVIQDFWLDLTRQVVAIFPPDLVSSISVSISSDTDTPPSVTYSGTDGMLVMLRCSGGLDGDFPVCGITALFASGRSLVFSAVLPIRSVIDQPSPPGEGAATLDGSTAVLGGGETIAGPSSVDLAGVALLVGAPETGDGLLLIRPPTSNAPDLPATVYLYPPQLLATGTQLAAETSRAEEMEQANAGSITSIGSQVATLQSEVATLSAGGLSPTGLMAALDAAVAAGAAPNAAVVMSFLDALPVSPLGLTPGKWWNNQGTVEQIP